MSNFIISFLNVLFFATFFISLDAKIGLIQKKPKKMPTANAAKVGVADIYAGFNGHNAVAGYSSAQNDESDLVMISDAKLAEQLDEITKVLPLFANYLVVRSLEQPRAALSLSVKAAKDQVKGLSAAEKNRLFLKNCRPDVRAQLPSKLQYLIDQLSIRQINGVAEKFTSLSAAKFICNKMDQPKLDRFVALLPKQKKEKDAEPPQKQKSEKTHASKKTETDIHAKHIHQDTDIETGSGDL